MTVDDDGPAADPASETSLVWLASYPRSGNTLLRLVLEDCFGLTTRSLYANEQAQPGANIVADDLEELRNGNELSLVKTHGLPPTTKDRAIYVVRDARAVLASYHSYLTDYQDAKLSIEEVIVGTQWPGDWSHHVARWLAYDTSNTLVIRYEDLASGNTRVLADVAKFLKRPYVKPFSLNFRLLNSLSPTFYKRGSNDQAVELFTRDHEALFELFHGKTMRQLGYMPDAAPSFEERLRREIVSAVTATRGVMASALVMIEADRAARLDLINALDDDCRALAAQLAASEDDRADRLLVIETLAAALAEQARRAEAEQLRAEGEIVWLNGDRAARGEVIGVLTAQLRAAEDNRIARLALINALDRNCQDLVSRLIASETERTERLQVIEHRATGHG